MITLGACFDMHAEPALESAVLNVQEAKGNHIVLDLEALIALDSRGLGKLFLTYHHLHRKHIRMSMINPRPAVREILEFVNFPRVVPIYDSIEAAVAFEKRRKEHSSFPQAVL